MAYGVIIFNICTIRSIMDRREALTILNVKQDSSQEEIKASYRKMALELHPDKNKENYEDTKFKKNYRSI